MRSRRLPGASGRHPSARPATASLQGTPRCTRRRGPTAPADGYRVRPASRGLARFARPPPPGEKTRDSPGEVAIAQRPQLAPELHAVRAPLPPALDHVRRGGPQDLASPLRAAGPRGPGTPQVRTDRGAAEALRWQAALPSTPHCITGHGSCGPVARNNQGGMQGAAALAPLPAQGIVPVGWSNPGAPKARKSHDSSA